MQRCIEDFFSFEAWSIHTSSSAQASSRGPIQRDPAPTEAFERLAVMYVFLPLQVISSLMIPVLQTYEMASKSDSSSRLALFTPQTKVVQANSWF